MIAFILLSINACRKPYAPEVIIAGNNYLVVDGFINTSVNGVTTINLSRARNIGDSTFETLNEGNAQIGIESSTGVGYPLLPTTVGEYKSAPLNLRNNETYRLNIVTADGKRYQSDLVAGKQSPPIDSLTWLKDGDVTIYANTHDPSNNSKYYRWDYTETWQYNTVFESWLGLDNNGRIFFRDSSNLINNCWRTAPSKGIVLGTSVALSEDVISKAPIKTIPENDERIGIRYSILVRQYALTEEAYQYYQIIQKNTEKTGTLFDLQPSQLVGNIHSLNSNEPVIGFVSAGSVQEKRLFIKYSEVRPWDIERPAQEPCEVFFIPQDPSDFRIYNYTDRRFVPYYFVTGAIAITKEACVDCRLLGGSNTTPSFW